MSETAWFRGEGGGLHEFALPLREVYAEQERAGRLTRVDPPTPAVAPVSAPVVEQGPPVDADADASLGSLERPARSDSKADWIAYALQVSDLSADEAAALTKTELIERFG